MWNYVYSDDPTLRTSLFGTVNLVTNDDIDKYKYSGYGIGFYMKEIFRFPTTGYARNVFWSRYGFFCTY